MREVGKERAVVVAAILIASLAACATQDAMVAKRTLTTTDGVTISMTADCGTGFYTSEGPTESLNVFTQLSIPGEKGPRWPVAFDFVKHGWSGDLGRRASGLLSTGAALIQKACGNFDRGPVDDKQTQLGYADRAVVLAIESGLHLEAATSSEDFQRILDKEEKRWHCLYLGAIRRFEHPGYPLPTDTTYYDRECAGEVPKSP